MDEADPTPPLDALFAGQSGNVINGKLAHELPRADISCEIRRRGDG